MNRAELLERLYDKYSKYFTSSEHFNVWAEDYKLILPESIDYSEVYLRIVLEHTDMYRPPAPAEINNIRIELQQKENHKLEKYVPFNDGVPPTEEWKKLRKKLGIKNKPDDSPPPV